MYASWHEIDPLKLVTRARNIHSSYTVCLNFRTPVHGSDNQSCDIMPSLVRDLVLWRSTNTILINVCTLFYQRSQFQLTLTVNRDLLRNIYFLCIVFRMGIDLYILSRQSNVDIYLISNFLNRHLLNKHSFVDIYLQTYFL